VRLPEGLEVDPHARAITAMGRKLFVIAAWYSPATPEKTVHEQETVEFFERIGYPLPKLPIAARSEALFFDVVTGENGWWLECQIIDDYDADPLIEWTWPDQPHDGTNFNYVTAAEFLVDLDEAAKRPGPPQQHWNPDMEYDDCVLPYQDWVGFDDWEEA